MKKKVMALVMVAAVASMMAVGCGSTKKETEKATEAATTAATEAATEKATEAATTAATEDGETSFLCISIQCID